MGKGINNKFWSIGKFFQKLKEEAGNWPVECFTLTDSEDQWQGILFVDQNLEESKKRKLNSTISRLSLPAEPPIAPDPGEKKSSAVSAEERSLLFDFFESSFPED